MLSLLGKEFLDAITKSLYLFEQQVYQLGVLKDPARYYSHHEAEFGMSWCAGFTRGVANASVQVLVAFPRRLLEWLS